MAPKTKQAPILLPPNLSPAALTPITHLLHLIIFRNKNQHCITKWWSSLTLLNRNIKRLLAVVESPEAGFRKNKESTLKLVVFLKEQVMPRCWLAFSALVADGQFAQLGLMLIALLAKASAVLRFPGEEVPKGELESVEEARAVEATTIVLPTEDFGEAITRDDDAEVDVGVSVERLSKKKSKKRHVLDADEGDEEAVDSTLEELVPKKRKMKAVETEVEAKASQPVAKPAKKVKKKKKKGDAFDDLFAGLV